MSRDTNRLLGLHWYGGKYNHINFILPLLPKTAMYVEPFGGSMSVLINKEPSDTETYNDLNHRVVHFYRMLREQPDALLASIEKTPYAREEYELAWDDTDGGDDIEKARRFAVYIMMGWGGLALNWRGSWSNFTNPSPSHSKSPKPYRWERFPDDLYRVHCRIKSVQIENRPALDVIKRNNNPHILLYCDPPYVHSARSGPRGYGYEMSDDDHRALAVALSETTCQVALSGYDNALYDEIYPAPQWHKVTARSKRISSSWAGEKLSRQEVLWMNYPPPTSSLL